MLTLTEQERRAFIAGDTATAALLARIDALEDHARALTVAMRDYWGVMPEDVQFLADALDETIADEAGA